MAAPWTEALEMQTRAMRAARQFRKLSVPSVTDRHVTSELPKAVPFYWSEDAITAVSMAAESIPLSACFERDLLIDGIVNTFWWLSKPIAMPMKNNERYTEQLDTRHICALLLSGYSDGSWSMSCARMTTAGYPLMMEIQSVQPLTTLEHLTREDALSFDPRRGAAVPVLARDITLLRFVLAAAAWLRQRILVASSGHIERHRRKQVLRDDGIEASDIKVIELRRSDSSSDRHEGTTTVEWSHRWVVTGHWRNQPTNKGSKLIFIDPYVKGPLDKPLRVQSQVVYTVNK